jgi:hypothetical protein
MRFITLLKTPDLSALGPPPPALFAALGALGGEATAAGVMLDTAGLAPAETATNVRLSGGEVTVTEGPAADAKEPVVAYAIYQVSSKEEVVEWVNRFTDCHKQHWPGWEGETEIRQLFGPEDMPSFQ